MCVRNVETVMGVIACVHCVDSMCVMGLKRMRGATGSNCVRSGMFFQGAVCVWFSKTMGEEKANFTAALSVSNENSGFKEMWMCVI